MPRVPVYQREVASPAFVVDAAGRRLPYVPLGEIEAAPRVYGEAFRAFLQYLRGLPRNRGESDEAIFNAYRWRIQRAMGEQFTGASRAAIEAALTRC